MLPGNTDKMITKLKKIIAGADPPANDVMKLIDLSTYRVLCFQALGIGCVGIIGRHFDHYHDWQPPHLFFFLMVTTFMIATFILILSCLVSLTTESIIAKTIYVSIKRQFTTCCTYSSS